MIFGTDITLSENISSGYMIIGFDARVIRDGKPIPPQHTFNFFQTCGCCDACECLTTPNTLAEIKAVPRALCPCLRSGTATLEELIELYQSHKDGIDRCNGVEQNPELQHWTDAAKYTHTYEVLRLADDVQSYMGEVLTNE